MNRRWTDLIAELTRPDALGEAPEQAPDPDLEKAPLSREAPLTPAEVEAVLARLEAHLVPLPTAADTAALIDRLRPLVPRPGPRRFRSVGLTREPLAAFLFAQLFHFRPVWWLASLAFVLVGLVIGPELAAAGLSHAVIAPPLVIGGVLYAFRSLRGAALELELSCPVTPTQVALGRILVPLGYYLLLGAIPGLAAGSAGRLFLAWTAALLLFTGLMLSLTLYMGTAAAAVTAAVVWGLLTALHAFRLSPFSLPDAPHWTAIQGIGLALGLILLLHSLAGRRLCHWLERGDR